MTELVDVLVSGTSFSNGVGVRVSPYSFPYFYGSVFLHNLLQILLTRLIPISLPIKSVCNSISNSYTNSISLLGFPNQHPNLFFPHILSTGLLVVSLSYKLNHLFLFVSVLVRNRCILD